MDCNHCFPSTPPPLSHAGFNGSSFRVYALSFLICLHIYGCICTSSSCGLTLLGSHNSLTTLYDLRLFLSFLKSAKLLILQLISKQRIPMQNLSTHLLRKLYRNKRLIIRDGPWAFQSYITSLISLLSFAYCSTQPSLATCMLSLLQFFLKLCFFSPLNIFLFKFHNLKH